MKPKIVQTRVSAFRLHMSLSLWRQEQRILATLTPKERAIVGFGRLALGTRERMDGARERMDRMLRAVGIAEPVVR